MTLTIREVAQQAGVSTATVSHVVNNTGHIGLRTRRLVLSAIRKLGYVPNAHARNLAAGDSRTLGIIASDIENPFFPEVIKSFEKQAHKRGYEVIFSNTNYEPAQMRRAAERMLQHRVRGVAVMTSEMSPQLIGRITQRRIAVAFLDLGEARKYASNLSIDYFSGIRQVVRHLHKLGHRHIGFAGGQSNLRSSVARQSAYVKSMKSLGLRPGPILHGDLRFDRGVRIGQRILRLKPMPTAVVAINDMTAVGVIKALTQAGVRVPEDVSVTGFDRTHLGEYITPTLTTVDIHRDLLGRMAADELHEISSSSRHQGKQCCIPAELIVGNSTGPAACRRKQRPSVHSSAVLGTEAESSRTQSQTAT